jgi:hypothetical protein
MRRICDSENRVMRETSLAVSHGSKSWEQLFTDHHYDNPVAHFIIIDLLRSAITI